MNEKNIKNISTKDLYLAFAIRINDEYKNNRFIGRFFHIEGYMLGMRLDNSKYDFVNILTDSEYNYFKQANLEEYQNGERAVMVIKLINTDEEFISYYQALEILNKYDTESQKQLPKKVKIKKIERKGN